MAGISTASKWHDELGIFSMIKSGLILEGNIRDNYPYPEEGCFKNIPLSLTQYLTAFYMQRGYSNVVIYDHLDGFYCHDSIFGANPLDGFAELIKAKVNKDRIRAAFSGEQDGAPQMVREALHQTIKPVVIIMDMVSRYVDSPEHLMPDPQRAFTIIQQGIFTAREVKTERGNLRNIIIFIVNKRNDMPAWMFLDCQQIKGIQIDYPSLQERRHFLAGGNLKGFFDTQVYEEDIPHFRGKEKEWKRLVDRFVARTEGFTYNELQQLQRLCRNRKIRVQDLCSVIDLYTYGIQENPWENPDLMERLRKGEEILTNRVKGQTEAITKTLDVIKRAVTGLSKTRNTNGLSPKGVLFFAGPTGTGKTETAKAIAELVFYDESACIRFDMSEYQQENSDQRLMGAPPGYVGYEAGGQLTNAVRKNPFSILLFDEIEKANPSILDKFLQILDDGRMTDGQGNTVYFTDCIIIFTSNKGIYVEDKFGKKTLNVSINDSTSKVRQKVASAIHDYFTSGLGKAEILNRIGENIVVFDFIRKDAAHAILDSRINNIINTILEEKGIVVRIEQEAKDALYEQSFANLEFGGRGINNKIESLLINPLARHIFEESPKPGDCYIIERLVLDAMPTDIIYRKE